MSRTTGTAYCATTDLLIGDIPTSTLLDPAKYVDDASDEMDSKIGFKYAIPVSKNSPTPAPVVLLLKRICVHLASGRLIMAATISMESTQLNSYGKSLVVAAQSAITDITEGRLLLAGVEESGLDAFNAHVPLIANKDTESAVDAFYDRVANPGYTFVPYGAGPYNPFPQDYPYGPDRTNEG